jgi:hypothetical protein
MTNWSVGQGDTGGDALAGRFQVDMERLRDGHDDLQAVLTDSSRIDRAGEGLDARAVPYAHLYRVVGDAQFHPQRPGGIF